MQLEPSWILHTTAYRDTSLIVDLWTLSHGRQALMARSARSARPAIRAMYQPFRPLLLSWTGAGDMKTLIGIEEAGRPFELDDRALACAYYCNELILRVLGKGQPQPELFGHYAVALAELAAGTDIEAVLRTFELQLLEAHGVLPDLEHSLRGGASVESGRRYRYHPSNAVAVPIVDEAAFGRLKPERRGLDEGGGGIADGDAALHPDGVTADEGVEVSGDTLLAMARLDFSDAAVRAEARPLMKRLLHLQLGDRPLNSRALFGALSGTAGQRERGPAADAPEAPGAATAD